MKYNILHVAVFFAAIAALTGSCSHETLSQHDNEFPDMKRVGYEEDLSVFPNPERGFYTPIEYHTIADPISQTTVTSCRAQGQSLLYLGYYLTDYMTGEIAQEYIDLMQANFDVLRKGGMKCVLRYAYKNDYTEENHPWDAEVAVVQLHINQLKALWQKNADVILCLQSGFIGVWGEWYYTDHFVFEPSSDEDFRLRRELIEVQLAALPVTRQICVRTPEYKQKVLRLSYKDTLTLGTAFNGSPQARIEGHNDCFVSGADDQGTFNDPRDRLFWESDTRYTIMGGETCNPSVFSECHNSLKTLEAQHWTYLNIEYHPNVIEGWQSGKCYEEIERRLGYRFVLKRGYYSPSAVGGGKFRVIVDIENCGFAAPVNPRDVELIIVGEDGSRAITKCNDDPRHWFAGETHRIDKTLTLPQRPGKYTLYLNLPDPEESIKNNSMFSIRLANKECWDARTGYNKLTDMVIM